MHLHLGMVSLKQDDGITIVLGSFLWSETKGSFRREMAELEQEMRANEPMWEVLKYPFN